MYLRETGGREKRVKPGGGKNAWNRGEREPTSRMGPGKMRGNPRGFIGQNPRKVRGVHALRGNPTKLPV